jgi:hypothetical protein
MVLFHTLINAAITLIATEVCGGSGEVGTGSVTLGEVR